MGDPNLWRICQTLELAYHRAYQDTILLATHGYSNAIGYSFVGLAMTRLCTESAISWIVKA
mgnify:FL=1